MKHKPTPGPWYAIRHKPSGQRDPSFSIATTKDYYPYNGSLEDCSIAGIWSGTPEDEANANLMAAAPDMLNALQFIAGNANACDCDSVSWYGEGHHTFCPIAIATRAIAIATKGCSHG